MAKVEEGWYIDPANPAMERWWMGWSWGTRTRPIEEGAQPLPEAGAERSPGSASETSTARAASSTPSTARPASGMRTAGQWMYVLAALAGVGAIIGAIIVIAHTAQVCVANPYNDAFGTDLQDCSNRHPWVGSGITIGLAGLIQAAVLAIVGRLCHAVDELRRAVAAPEAG